MHDHRPAIHSLCLKARQTAVCTPTTRAALPALSSTWCVLMPVQATPPQFCLTWFLLIASFCLSQGLGDSMWFVLWRRGCDKKDKTYKRIKDIRIHLWTWIWLAISPAERRSAWPSVGSVWGVCTSSSFQPLCCCACQWTSRGHFQGRTGLQVWGYFPESQRKAWCKYQAPGEIVFRIQLFIPATLTSLLWNC